VKLGVRRIVEVPEEDLLGASADVRHVLHNRQPFGHLGVDL
jgi:hypothetical protein